MIEIFKTDKGQTLLEMLIAVAVGTLIIAAVLGLATRSARNANFARASSQASKLSQQGLEIIRNIRSEEDPDTIFDSSNGCTFPATSCEWDELYENDIGVGSDGGSSPGVEFRLYRPGEGLCPPSESWCLSEDITPPETITNDNQNFTRRVYIADTARVPAPGGFSDCHTVPPNPNPNNFTHEDAKQVTVVVSWDDPVGSHDVTVFSCINDIRD